MRSALSLMLVLVLVSCATKPPEREELKGVNVPTNWTSTAEPGAVVDQWWLSFGSSNLTAVVKEALRNNFDIKVAVGRMDAAIARARVEGAEQYPWVGADFDARRAKQNFIGLPIPGSGGEVLSTRSTTYGASLTATWEVDVWGRIRSGVRAALAEVQASEADLAGARQSIAAQSAKAWLAVIEAQRQVRIAEARATSFESTARQLLRRYERGLSEPLDVRLAMASAAATRSGLEARRDQLQRVKRQLQILLGQYPDAQTGTTNALPDLPSEIPAGLPSGLLERRPDLVAAERRLASADQRLVQAKRAMLPRISLSASGGTSSAELADLVDTDFTVWSLAANAAQPLFQGGRLRAQVAEARANAERLLAEYAKVALTAFGEVEERLEAGAYLAEQEVQLAEELKQSRASLRLAEERYAAGLEIILTVLVSQRAVFDAESSLATVQRQILDNRIDLHLALGGGFTMGEEAVAQTSRETNPPDRKGES